MRYMSLFAQIAEHQFSVTGILIAFKDLSRQDIHKEIVDGKEKIYIEPCACTIMAASTPVLYNM